MFLYHALNFLFENIVKVIEDGIILLLFCFCLISDNVFSIKSWIKNKFSFDDSIIDKQFGIPEDFDYVD